MCKVTHSLKLCIVAIIGVGACIMSIREGKKQADVIIELEERANKNAEIIKVFSLWMQHKQENKSICDFFRKNDIHEIAIYGMHYMGERLLEELRGTGIIVKYAIDRNVNISNREIRILKPDDNLEKVDAVVVTSIFYLDEIEKQLSFKISCPIISLEDVVNNS